MSNYNIIGSSSAGNAIVYMKEILVDVGLPYSKIEPYLDDIQIILLTHEHGDHFNKRTIKKIGKTHPNILLCVPDALALAVKDMGYAGRVFHFATNRKYKFSRDLFIESFQLFHDVDNVGYKIHYGCMKIVHATDTGSLDHIEAKGYDLYAIEHNHDEEIINETIKNKLQDGAFIHEIRSKETHLSFQQAEEWIDQNNTNNGEVIMLHISQSYLKE